MLAQLWGRYRAPLLFCVSGGLAMLVDIGVLYVGRPWFGNYGGRALSFLAAVTFTWLFSRNITFSRTNELGAWKEYLAYLSSMLVGGAVNYGAYAASLYFFGFVRVQPAWGVAIGSLSGLTFNYLSARRIIQGKQ